MLSTEQLLAPRFKVIADYPGANYKVNEIVTFFWSGRFTQMLCDKPPMLEASGKTITGLATIEWFDRFPAIFQRLQWWEDRQKSDMPDYVRIDDLYITHGFEDGTIRKVTAWNWSKSRQQWLCDLFPVVIRPHEIPKLTPSSLTEYEAYKTK